MRKVAILLLLMMVSSLHAQFKTNYNLSRLSQPDFTVTERNNDGSIKSVRYAPTDPNIPASANEFFKNTLKKRDADDFILDRSKDTDYGMYFERYQQYYQGVLVDDGHYNFRFKNSRMKVVTGHYVNVDGINPVPSITKAEAINLYASYFGIEKRDTIGSYVALIIKEVPNADKKDFNVVLTYRVFLQTPQTKDGYVGYFDAHTGKLLYKEDAFVDISATGQFYTYYNRNNNDTPKYGITEYSNNVYSLEDYTRGNGIKTGTYNGQPYFFSDTDNIWTRQEMGSFNLALDVHWTMQQIYDLMNSLYNHNSYNGAGCYIISTIDTINGAGYNNGFDNFIFGNASGSTIHDPFASVDIIGHEFGHAISYKTSNIQTNQSETLAIHEGLADIWGIIFEKHITPNADYWKTGEQIMLNGNSCIRNFQNPGDVNASSQIATTYNCGAFNSSDPHIVGGILPYWFYLLVNGGYGTNELNRSYQLVPVGFDLAENLFIHTALGVYLEGSTSFEDVMYSFIDSAYDMGNDFLAEQVRNAWYAVGVGPEPSHIYCLSYAPGSATYYVYGNSNCTVSWSFTKTYGSMPSLVPNYSNYSCTVNTSSSFTGFLHATIYSGVQTATYSLYISGAASPSSNGNDVLQVIPVDETHFQLSLDGEFGNGHIKVYDATSLQQKINEKFENGHYVLDTSSWKHGLYIIEATIGDKIYTRKLNIKK